MTGSWNGWFRLSATPTPPFMKKPARRRACAEWGRPSVYVAHAGDSRAYLISPDGDIRQLTVDHSMVQELVDKGDLTEQEAKVHPQKNIITRALGVQPSVEVDFCSHPFPPGGRLLICTDGLSNNVGTKQISQLSKQLGPEEFCERLISLAKDAGGSDNITVAIIEN